MIELSLFPDAAGKWPDLMDLPLLNPMEAGNLVAADIERLGLLRHGTQEGAPTVSIVVKLPNGQRVVAQTTWRLLRDCVNALKGAPIVREWEAAGGS